MKIRTIMMASGILSLLAAPVFAASIAICPAVSDLHYTGDKNGTIVPPKGWYFVGGPSTADNTPSKWLEASWESLGGKLTNSITCFYGAKGSVPNTATGGWTISKGQTPSPWTMANRSAAWHEAGSPFSYICNANTGGTREACSFPVN